MASQPECPVIKYKDDVRFLPPILRLQPNDLDRFGHVGDCSDRCEGDWNRFVG